MCSVCSRPYGQAINGLKKGTATEAAVLAAFARRGWPTAIPFGEGQPYDLLVEPQSSVFLRVQCKTGRIAKGALEFNARSTDHGGGRRSYRGFADLFGVCQAGRADVYLIPVAEVRGVTGRLRFHPPRNNQRKRVKFAADYAIASWAPGELVAFAQSRRALEQLSQSVSRSMPA